MNLWKFVREVQSSFQERDNLPWLKLCWFSEDYWRDENYVPHDIQNSIQFDYKE